jgi:anthranilate synthase component 1
METCSAIHGDEERSALGPPEVLRFAADLTTPVRAFLALTRPGQDAFLLESVAGGETQARYSFMGWDPTEVLEVGDEAVLRSGDRKLVLDGPPLEALRNWVNGFTDREAKHDMPFMGGAVGWMDFSSMHFVEPVLAQTFRAPRKARMVFGLFTTGMVFDHLKQEACLYRFPRGQDAGGSRDVLELFRTRLEGPIREQGRVGPWTQTAGPDRERFSRNIAAVKEAILEGEAYQIVVSEPFEGRYDGDPFEVYRKLRRLNPSPYHFYVSLSGRQVLGASPEMLVRVEGETVTTVPIAGTRPRGKTPEEDERLERDLLQDPKELAEHAMLVDLARNDLSRVCRYGSVSVSVRGAVERFSHVMHMTSEVRGKLDPRRSSLEALWNTFPAGTVSGAPKIRAVQILSELEGVDRGVYGGAVGTVDTSGNLETCIAIRTAEFEGGTVRFRSGAGIVADSRADSEWNEIHHKAGAMIAALGGHP